MKTWFTFGYRQILAAVTVCVLFAGCGPGDSAAYLGETQGDTNQAEASISGENSSGDNLGGTNLGGANLGGSNLGGVNLGGANLGGTNLGGANLAGSNLGGTNLGGANLGGNNLAGTNLGGVNLAGANLAGANLAGSNLAGSNLSGSNLAGSNLAGANLAGTNLAGANLSAAGVGEDILLTDENRSTITTTGTWITATDGNPYNGAYKYAVSAASLTVPFNGIRATIYSQKCHYCGIMRVKIDGVQVALVDLYAPSGEWRAQVYTTPVLSKQAHTLTVEWTGTMNSLSTGKRISFDALRIDRGGAKMLRTAEDLRHLDNKTSSIDPSCVVMGIGSTAFSRLVTANGDNQMYALVDKLPWGFAKDPAGVMELGAWEVLVWGSTSYCVFVVPAPKNATFEGVGGFVKAVFRWNAPPTKSISIGQIGGGRTPKTYTGMMNAAAHFSAGRVSEDNLIAGLLSFVTATTNNISVEVDFASYIQMTNGDWTVLGNPTVISGTMQYAEGSFVSVLKDGEYRIVSFSPRDQNYYGAIDRAYDAYLSGLGPQPVPKRCLGARYLKDTRGVAVPAGKCDSGIAFHDLGSIAPVNAMQWLDMSGAVVNDLTSDLVVGQGATFDGAKYPAIGGTHVFLNVRPY